MQFNDRDIIRRCKKAGIECHQMFPLHSIKPDVSLDDPEWIEKAQEIDDAHGIPSLVETSMTHRIRRERWVKIRNFLHYHHPEIYDTVTSIVEANGNRKEAQWLLFKKLQRRAGRKTNTSMT